jgi:rare lipoprotein A
MIRADRWIPRRHLLPMLQRIVTLICCCALLAACSARHAVVRRGEPSAPPAPSSSRGGGYYQDDGPGANAPADIVSIPDATPRREALNRAANNPYTVLGHEYVPMREIRPFRQRGVASWYGRKFHGQKTSSGETYDMYAMTAAHPTLPIPSYARVSNPANGRSVVVRVNDRGPFLGGRIVDLSYSAAAKLGLVGNGSGQVLLESVLPGETTQLATAPAPTIAVAPPADAAGGDDPVIRLASRDDVPQLPEISDGRDTWLQLGAFGNRENADSFREHMASQLAALGEKLVVRSQGAMNRVQLGPYRDAGEARRVAAQIREALAVQALVVQH